MQPATVKTPLTLIPSLITSLKKALMVKTINSIANSYVFVETTLLQQEASGQWQQSKIFTTGIKEF